MIVTILRWFVLATITGAIVGTGTSLFLKGLYFFTDKSSNLPLWITMCLLPIGGLLNGLILYFGYRNGSKDKKDSVIAAVHEQSGLMPYKTIAIKPIAAIITLASGGSAGKEGPCSHIGGTLASWFGHIIRLSPELQKRLVACGVSAGFASVFGTPIAGAIYGIEVLTIGRIRHDFIFPAVIAGVTSFEVSKLWGITYDYYPIHLSEQFSNSLFIKILLIGMICGLISWLLIELFELVRRTFSMIQQRLHIWPPMMPFIGGLILSILLLIIPADYFGLSLPIMDDALSGERVSYLGWFWKIILVSITLGSGFYGGIVTPQFVIGAIVGNVLAHVLGINPVLGAAVGMVSVVASASNTPIAAVFMGFELFGSFTGIYVVGACITAYITIGHRSVYPDQMVAYPKSLWMRLVPGIALENEKIHVSYTLLKKIKRWQSHQKRIYVYLKRPKKL
ncbi:chloride channel protein [Neobacillus cucumis]|uniref:Chloride channel protein n=2 Tax=Neobacillus cucumis TaxID=1740721 RepID=A0A2N5HW01_9BACI|nr:chloride channel protein [Neobacillus cucumis]